ncbi:MAG: signal peptidase I [Chloroflexi bacterium]|nr:signal peptidase I [Chloroflexota bacterium]
MRGFSMWPTLNAHDRVLVDRLIYLLRSPRAFEIAIVDAVEGGARSIKRIVGRPGQRVILDGRRLTIDGHVVPEPYLPPAEPWHRLDRAVWQLGADEFVILGDNREESLDSRQFGPIKRRQLLGLVWRRYAPLSRRGELHPPAP